ncbi:MAG: leucyl aminopeptidase [Steroidobacteraceae bacterium]
MNFDLWSKKVPQKDNDCCVVGVFDGGKLGKWADEVDRQQDGRISQLVKRGDFSGKLGETLLLPPVAADSRTRVLLVGQGAQKNLNRRAWRRALVSGFNALARTRIQSATIALDVAVGGELPDALLVRSAGVLCGQAIYRINDLKSGTHPPAPALRHLTIGPVASISAAGRRAAKQAAAITVGMRTQRDLANLPGNHCTPTYLAATARRIARDYKSVKLRILDRNAIKREKMGCFLAVTQGSDEPPQFIVLEHRPARPSKRGPVVLVGKGVTFDTGGISLKDPPAMDEMKFDMSGAATVLGAVHFAAEYNLPLHVIALVPACENMPGGRAIKPGDIVTSASGQTVEILNTDAEGRLILCDALHYARRYKPSALIDVATLTGACVVALGAHHSGLMSNDDALASELLDSGLRADDRLWRLPLTEEYAEQLRSNFADMANVGGRDGGAITAATFLSKFTTGMIWAHIDIAGTAYLSGANKGSTGRPLPTLADFLLKRAGQ